MGEAIMLKCLGGEDPKSAGKPMAQLSDLQPSNKRLTPEREGPEWERWIHLSNAKLRGEASGQHVTPKRRRLSGLVIKLSTLCGAAICFYLSFTLIIVTLKSAVRSGKKTTGCHSDGQAGTERDRVRKVVFRCCCLSRGASPDSVSFSGRLKFTRFLGNFKSIRSD